MAKITPKFRIAFIIAVCFLFSVIGLQAQTTIFNEDFEGPLQVTPSGVPVWALNSSLQVSGTNSYNNVVAFNDSSMFVTNVIDLTGYNFVILDFRHICKIEFFDAAEIFISTNNGTSWTKLTQTQYLGTAQFGTNGDKFTATSYPTLWLPSQHSEPPTNSWWMHEQFNISAIAGNQSQVRFKFKLRDGNSNGANTNAGWFLDDIRIVASPNELIPPVVTLNTPILQDTVYSAGPFSVSATITDASGINSAQLIFRLDSTVWDTITMNFMGADVYAAEIPGQPYNTVVDYRVRAVDASLSYNETQTIVRTFINKKPPPVVIVGTGTVTQYNIPCNGFYGNGWSGSLYTAAEISANGLIDSIGFYVNNTVAAYLMSNQAMYLGHRSYNVYDASMNTMPDIMLYTQIFTGNVTWTGPGWYMFKLATPFLYNGSQTLEVVWMNNFNTWSSGYPIFASTTLSQNLAKYNYQDGSMPTGPGTLTTTRPNLKLVFMPNDNDYDAGIFAITEPTGVVLTSSPYDVRVQFKNYGIVTLTDLDIEWELNGVAQTPYVWSGTLLEDVVSPITTVGSTSAFVLGNNTLRVWTSEPNGLPDENQLNDTMTVVLYGCDNIMNGNYTINTTLPTAGTNFASFADAFLALNNCGVNGPVVINVAPGTYNTRLLFNGMFPGVSATNTVTFRGAPGTVIQHTTTVSDQRSAVLFSGARHIRLDSLTITIPNTSSFGVGVQLTGASENIQITNCIINVHNASTSTNYYGIAASGSLTSATTTGNSAHNILIQNNIINGGYYGIVLYGVLATPLNNIQIVGNTLNTPYYYGIRTDYINSLNIQGNTVLPRVSGGSTFNYGVYINYCYSAYSVTQNIIRNSGAYGLYIANSIPASGRPLIANNEIAGFTSTGTPYGMYFTSSSNMDVLYNSVNVDKGTGRAIFTLASVTGMRVLNNSFVYSGTGAGYAAYHSGSASLTAHNYNNYFSSGTTFVFYGTAIANLAALQAVNVPAGNDLNSVSADPIYVSATNLYPLGGTLNNVAQPLTEVTVDIQNLLRDVATPDMGAYEYVPVAGDIGLEEALLSHGQCITNNDSLYVTLKNVIGSLVDFSVNPLTINYQITGPVNSSGTRVVNSGTLAVGSDVKLGFDGMDLSLPGTYSLNAYISANAVNLLTVNDTIWNAHSLTVNGYTFDAQPNTAFITTPVQTVDLTVTSNMFPGGSFLITEICHFKTATGQPSGGWPSYLIADDYIEITGVANSDLAGFTLEQWSTTVLTSTHTFPVGTVLSPNGTAIIAVGEMNSSVPSPANYYYHGNGTFTNFFSSSDATGRILKDPSNTIIDVVGYNTYTFPVAAGVTPTDWAGGSAGSPGSTSGIRLIGPDVNSATNWVVSSSTNPQNPNALNAGVVLPVSTTLTDFSWSLGGIVTSVNSIDTVVGPWTTNGLYQYVATYDTPCGVFTDTVHITVFIPQFDLVLEEILEPIGNECYYNSQDITVRISNLGTDIVPAGFNAYYTIDGGAPVVEVVSQPVPPGGFIDYTFATPLVINFTGIDTTVFLNTYVNYVPDPFQHNDTLGMILKLLFSPDPPVISNVDIPYGTSAVLNATSPGVLTWFANPPVTPIFAGNPFTTPILYDTTYYWVQAGMTLNHHYTFDSDLEGWTPLNPCGYSVNFVWNSDAGNGTAFVVNSSTTNAAVLMSPTYNVNADSVSFSFRHRVNAETCCDEHYVQYSLDGGPWQTFMPSVNGYTTSSGYVSNNPFNCSASISSQPGWYGNIAYMNTSGHIPTTGASTLQIAFVATADGSVGVEGWYIDEVSIEANGCASDMVQVAVNVTGIPAIDVGPVAINAPNTGIDLGSQTVSVDVRNWGTDPVSNIPVSYSVNGGAPVTETISATLQPGDVYTYQFTSPYQFVTYGTFIFTVYTHLTGDLITVNDTLEKTVNNNPLVYCDSYATSTAYGDIGHVSISNLDNGDPIPVINNPLAANAYSDFTLSLPPVQLAHGNTYPMSVSGIWPGSFYTSYVKAFIDYNIDGVFDPVNELVFEGLMSSAAVATITGNVTVPLTASSGFTRMRVVMVETSSALSVQPCGTYTWGETEDYMVVIAPQLAQDAGVIAIVSPAGIYSEGDLQNVILEVRNFGTDPLTSIPLSYQHNANPPVLQTWSGNLAPGATVQVNMPPLTVANGSNSICASTAVAGDSNTFNDEACGTFWGLPGLIMFEDNFEGSSDFTTTGTVWQHGVPNGTVINSAFEGDSSWVTVLNGPYPSMATEYLVSKPFNFTGVNDAYLSLGYWMDGEENMDGGNVQYSTNNGITWTTLGVINDTEGYNWYDTYVGALPSWSKPTGGWKAAFISLSPLNNISSNVLIRFAFRSNASVQNEGFAVDDVKIHVPALPVDAGVSEVVTPNNQSITGSANQVTVRLKNYGTTVLTSVPVSYKVTPGPPVVNAIWTGTLNPGDETDYTFTTTYNGPTVAHVLCAFTLLGGDVYKFNDSTCVALTPGAAAIDAGVVDILAPTVIPAAGQNVNVTIQVTNFGTNALTNIPVQYSVNGTVQTTEVIQSTLNSGASTNYTFVSTFVSPGMDIQICARTAVASDAIPTNDQYCEDINVGINETEISGVMLYQNMPNPAVDETEIAFYIPTPGKVVFTLTNVLGQSMISQTSDYDAGKHVITLNLKDIASGIYYYSIVVDDIQLTRKMTVQ